MQELQPLLAPANRQPLQPAGLQRFQAYLALTTDALKALQAAVAPAPVQQGSARRTEPEGFLWPACTPASATVLALACQLMQQVPGHALPQVSDCQL